MKFETKPKLVMNFQLQSMGMTPNKNIGISGMGNLRDDLSAPCNNLRFSCMINPEMIFRNRLV